MKETQILKELFTVKNILLGILFNVLAFGSMYLFLDLFLYLRYNLQII